MEEFSTYLSNTDNVERSIRCSHVSLFSVRRHSNSSPVVVGHCSAGEDTLSHPRLYNTKDIQRIALIARKHIFVLFVSN